MDRLKKDKNLQIFILLVIGILAGFLTAEKRLVLNLGLLLLIFAIVFKHDLRKRKWK
ncbi:hypothetical protein [Enterococcus sp. AZ109]|uniref:hypothetical protein n=1 Tax=Enterococcus sp. AZ109 TaxID=2774634 RepID=UPI003F26CC03